jgi:hypothetical protein
MRGNSIGQRSEPPKPRFFRFAKGLACHPVIGPTDDRPQGHDNNVKELMLFLPLDSRIL